jgi:hypothetical protein
MSKIDRKQPYGELYIAQDGTAHFICHTVDEDFEKTEIAIRKFMALFQQQIDGQGGCPFAPKEGKG